MFGPVPEWCRDRLLASGFPAVSVNQCLTLARKCQSPSGGDRRIFRASQSSRLYPFVHYLSSGLVRRKPVSRLGSHCVSNERAQPIDQLTSQPTPQPTDSPDNSHDCANRHQGERPDHYRDACRRQINSGGRFVTQDQRDNRQVAQHGSKNSTEQHPLPGKSLPRPLVGNIRC